MSKKGAVLGSNIIGFHAVGFLHLRFNSLSDRRDCYLTLAPIGLAISRNGLDLPIKRQKFPLLVSFENARNTSGDH